MYLSIREDLSLLEGSSAYSDRLDFSSVSNVLWTILSLACCGGQRRNGNGQRPTAKPLKREAIYPIMVIVVICDDSEIEVPDGERCTICGRPLQEFDEVTGTGVFGYYHWTCVTHFD